MVGFEVTYSILSVDPVDRPQARIRRWHEPKSLMMPAHAGIEVSRWMRVPKAESEIGQSGLKQQFHNQI